MVAVKNFRVKESLIYKSRPIPYGPRPEWFKRSNYAKSKTLTDVEWLEQLSIRLSVRTRDLISSPKEASEMLKRNIDLIETYGIVEKKHITNANAHFHLLSEIKNWKCFKSKTKIRFLDFFDLMNIKCYAEQLLADKTKPEEPFLGQYGQIFLALPLKVKDRELKKQFLKIVKQIRKNNKTYVPVQWQSLLSDCYLLQYLDITHWLKRIGFYFNNEFLYQLIQNEDDIRKSKSLFENTTHKYAEMTMSKEFLQRAALKVLSKN